VSEERLQEHSLVVPSFKKAPELRLDMSKIREAEGRIHESKTVNPSTYKDLEYAFNEAWRDLKRHLSQVGYQISLAEREIEEAKADVLLDKYPEFMAGRPKSQDNADTRKAFLARDEGYSQALDRFNQMKALESVLDSKARAFEKTCAFMKKSIELILRSGISSANIYNTQK
jgi:hypothetical protein